MESKVRFLRTTFFLITIKIWQKQNTYKIQHYDRNLPGHKFLLDFIIFSDGILSFFFDAKQKIRRYFGFVLSSCWLTKTVASSLIKNPTFCCCFLFLYKYKLYFAVFCAVYRKYRNVLMVI